MYAFFLMHVFVSCDFTFCYLQVTMEALGKKQAALKAVEDELQGLQDQFDAANKKKEVCCNA